VRFCPTRPQTGERQEHVLRSTSSTCGRSRRGMDHFCRHCSSTQSYSDDRMFFLRAVGINVFESQLVGSYSKEAVKQHV